MYKERETGSSVEKINKVFTYMKEFLHPQNNTSFRGHSHLSFEIDRKRPSLDKNVASLINHINNKLKYRPTKEDIDILSQYPLSMDFFTRYKGEESKYIGKCLKAKKNPKHDMHSAYKLSFTAKECGISEYSGLYMYFDNLLIDIYNR